MTDGPNEAGDPWAPLRAHVRARVAEFREAFAESLAAELPSADPEDLRRYLAAYLEEEFRGFAEQLGAELVALRGAHAGGAAAVEASAREGARAHAPRVPPDLASEGRLLDAPVLAAGAVGISVMALSSVALGGLIALSAPVLAHLLREKANRALKERAAHEAPAVVRTMAAKMETNLLAEIDRWAGAGGAA